MTPPVSVIVPTVGRIELLERCLESILACDPVPGEVIVNDQSHGDDVAALCSRLGVRRIPDAGRGIARATNNALRAAANDVVLRTDDDCTVAPDWIAVAAARMAEQPDGLVTGRVLAGGDASETPSIITAELAIDHTGAEPTFVVYSGNMAVNRHRVLELGGFDERPGLRVAASDNDLSWRWLSAGLPLRYEPAMVVWHHDWRDTVALQRRYRAYALGQGALYAKHLASGDRRIRPLVRRDVVAGLRGVKRAGVSPSRWRVSDERRALVWVPVGMIREWWRSLTARRPSG
jgi:GT2 family glycosyltransferase